MSNTVTADIDGDGVVEEVTGNGSLTQVRRNGMLLWQHTGPIDGYNRGDDDYFYAADVDGDHKSEIFVTDNVDKWTAVFKWDGIQLRTVWASASPLHGPAGSWNRGPDDQVLPADVDGDGQTEILLYDNADKWTGILKWLDGKMQTWWMRPSPLTGPGGSWQRGNDIFSVNANNSGLLSVVSDTNNHAVLHWEDGTLAPVVIYHDRPPAPNCVQKSVSLDPPSVEIGFSVPFPSMVLAWFVTWIEVGTGTGQFSAPTLPPTASGYTIQDLHDLTNHQYNIQAAYIFVDGWQSLWSSDLIVGTAPPPPPSVVTVPNVIGQLLGDALAQLTADYLQGAATNVGPVNPGEYMVDTQQPAAGKKVTSGTVIDLTVTPVSQHGYGTVQVINSSSDGRAVDLYLVDHVQPNVAIPEGSLALGGVTGFDLQNNGHVYQVIAVDTGMPGCADASPFTAACQRTTSPLLPCAPNGGLYTLTVT